MDTLALLRPVGTVVLLLAALALATGQLRRWLRLRRSARAVARLKRTTPPASRSV